MGFFSRQAIEWMDRPLQDDRSYPSNTQQLQYYYEDLLSALAERGVSEESLCAVNGGQLLDYYEPKARYHYYEVLEAEDASTQDLVAALGEVAFRLQEQRPTILLSMINEPKEIDPFKQLMLIA